MAHKIETREKKGEEEGKGKRKIKQDGTGR